MKLRREPAAVSSAAILLAAFTLVSCSAPEVSTEVVEEPPALETAESSEMQGVPSYATAMERHKPLGKVIGSLRPDPQSGGAIGKYEDALRYAEDMQSYSLLIWRDGALELEHYFPPYTEDLRAESASMHKSVVGLLVAAAIADGHINSADDRVGDYVPEWGNDPRGDITLRHLLTMSSGLEPLSTEGGETSDAVKYIFDGAAARATTLNRPLKGAPGEEYHYMGVASQLLVMALENATDQPYTDYLSARLWKSIGADDAYVWLNEEGGFPRGYTALLARARDWLRVGLLIKDHGVFEGEEIIPASLIDEATSSSVANPNYGWQIWLGATHEEQRFYDDGKTSFSVLASEPFLVDDMIYFDGFGGQRVYISRSEDLVIIRQGALRFDWDDAILPNLVIKAGK